MSEVDRRTRDEKSVKSSVKSSARSRYSKRSKASSTSSRAKFLEAKARQAGLQTKLADKIEAAEQQQKIPLMKQCAEPVKKLRE
jgi:hypothetical protein